MNENKQNDMRRESPEIRLFPKEKWPQALLQIPQPPKSLYIKGPDLPQDLIYLCVVGSRRHTSYGKEACQKLISGLAGYPICIVSGLALGIDSVAHEAALNAGLLTVAFPGSGLNEEILYPRYNLKLAEKILAVGGSLISEFEPDLSAAPWTFPKRNRLMAGLSQAVLIIEAAERSGTLITSRYATDYNKEVLALPGSIFSLNSTGPNDLIRQGAIPVTKSDDILHALKIQVAESNSEEFVKQFDLTAQEKFILDIISSAPQNKEALQEISMLPIHELNIVITMLEIKGIIKEQSGEYYIRKK